MRFWVTASVGAILAVLTTLLIWDVARIDLVHTLRSDQVILPADTPEKDALDLVAQQRMADWAFWMVVLTAISAAATFISIIVAATVAGRQLEQGRSTNIIQSRAYLHMNGTRHLSHRQPDGKVFWRVWVDWINVGATPAIHSHITVTLTRLGEEASADIAPENADFGLVVRSQGVMSTGPFDMYPEDIEESLESGKLFVLTGRASYDDVFDNTERHQTLFRVILRGYSGNVFEYFDNVQNPVFLAWNEDYSVSTSN